MLSRIDVRAPGTDLRASLRRAAPATDRIAESVHDILESVRVPLLGFLRDTIARGASPRSVLGNNDYQQLTGAAIAGDVAMFLGGIAVSHYVAGRFREALQYSSELLRLRPGFHGAQRLRCASLAQIGRLDEAREFLVTIRREPPQLSVEWIRQSVPYQTPELMERFLEGMRKAGLED